MNRLKLGVLFAAGLLVAGVGVLLAGSQWTGWLTDGDCAKAGKYAGASHAKHVADGKPLVFVSETDNKVHMIANPEKVKSLAGEKVTLIGTAKSDGAIEAESAVKTN